MSWKWKFEHIYEHSAEKSSSNFNWNKLRITRFLWNFTQNTLDLLEFVYSTNTKEKILRGNKNIDCTDIFVFQNNFSHKWYWNFFFHCLKHHLVRES